MMKAQSMCAALPGSHVRNALVGAAHASLNLNIFVRIQRWASANQRPALPNKRISDVSEMSAIMACFW
jgi:hypothetical protein